MEGSGGGVVGGVSDGGGVGGLQVESRRGAQKEGEGRAAEGG